MKICCSLYLHACRSDANLGHLICIRSDIGRDAEQHFDVLSHLLRDLVQQCWTHGAQLQMKNIERMEQSRGEENKISV